MNLLLVLENGLFAIGQLLRLPVMILLWLCVLSVLAMSASCLIDYLARRRERVCLQLDAWLREGSVLTANEVRIACLPSELRKFLKLVHKTQSESTLHRGGLEHAVLKSEEIARGQLNSARMLVKAGPSLGLIGTLIPMGSSMAAMASGNLEAMAGQMVVAFTTTIIGIACGTVAFVVLTVRQHWLNETLREERYLAEHILAEIGDR